MWAAISVASLQSVFFFFFCYLLGKEREKSELIYFLVLIDFGGMATSK